MSSHPSRIVLFVMFTMIVAACTDPVCPHGYIKIGGMCRRQPDAGTSQDGGVDAASGDDEPDLAPECAGREALETFCENDKVATCSADRLAVTAERCPSHSKCSTASGKAECTCEAGYEVQDGACVAVARCADDPCGPHGAECRDTPDGFTCTCDKPWAGARCQAQELPPVGAPTGLIFDSENERLISCDLYLRAVIAYDTDDGQGVVLSGAGVGAGVELQAPRGLARWADDDDLYIVDQGLQAVVRVDATAGQRTVVSGPELGDGPTLAKASGLEFSPDGKRLLTTSSTGFVAAIDRKTGERSLLSGASEDDSRGGGPAFSRPCGLAVDRALARTFILDCGLKAVFELNLSDGKRSLISGTDATGAMQGSGPQLATPSTITFDTSLSRLLVRDGRRLYAIDVASGARTLLPDVSTYGLIVEGEQRIWALDGRANAIFRIDPQGGESSIVSNLAIGASSPHLPVGWRPSGLVKGTTAEPLFTASRGELGLYRIDAATGESINFCGFGTMLVRRLAIDPVDDAELTYIDSEGDIHACPTTSTATSRLISATGNSTFDVGLATGLAVDSSHGRILVAAQATSGQLISVDSETGARSVYVATSLAKPSLLTIDAAHDRMFVVDGARLFAVDLNTAQLSAFDDGEGVALSSPSGLAVHGDQLLLADSTLDALISIDLATKERRVISGYEGSTVKGLGFRFSSPESVAVDAEQNRAFVVDGDIGAVLAVDLNSGDRLIFSKAASVQRTTP